MMKEPDNSKTETNLITVCMVCYREGEMLREAWESVLAQNFEHWEAVLVKDGNSDKATDAVFNSIEHPRLRKFTFDENMGAYPCRNKAIELAGTEFVIPLDTDDKLLPTSLEDLYSAVSEHDADYTYGNYQYFGELNKSSDFQFPLKRRNMNIGCFPSIMMIRKRIWEELGGYYSEGILSRGNADMDFVIGILEGEYRGCATDRDTYCYRKHSDAQISRSYKTARFPRRKLMVERHRKYFRCFLHRLRFLGYAALHDAAGYSEISDERNARKFAFISIIYGCWMHPSSWTLLMFAKPFRKG